MLNNSILLADGFERAFLGIGEHDGKSIPIYSVKRAIRILIERDGMSYDDAREYLDFNVLSAFISDPMPIWIEDEMHPEDQLKYLLEDDNDTEPETPVE